MLHPWEGRGRNGLVPVKSSGYPSGLLGEMVRWFDVVREGERYRAGAPLAWTPWRAVTSRGNRARRRRRPSTTTPLNRTNAEERTCGSRGIVIWWCSGAVCFRAIIALRAVA